MTTAEFDHIEKPTPLERHLADRLDPRLSCLEICAGAGGLALGLERAGFDPVLLLDNRPVACETLRANRPAWDVREIDLVDFDPAEEQKAYDVDLLAGGLPRVKGTAAVNRTRSNDVELGLFRAAIELIYGVQPRAVLFENVPDVVTKDAYAPLRDFVAEELDHLGYKHEWFVCNAADHGVPQDRAEGVLIAFKGDGLDRFRSPEPLLDPPITVGMALGESMAAGGWHRAVEWAAQADRLAPTIVGGSWDRGGADLGMTGSKRAWARLGVDGGTIADAVPGPDFHWDPELGRAGMMPLTVEQVAVLQGFPDDWKIMGRKTARYRQVGNATPPPLAEALGLSIRAALLAE
ncbi:DNA cytosine methyltransferase [Streptomyces sp. NPDC053542]|uniref:DNA cytosine methyltransferase n=1 Tax=Streptomyces sp. NPDC053542 TaxID=3365710 RepID=UPI0037D49E8B